MIRVASILLWIQSIGFGLPCMLGIRSLLLGRGIYYMMGFPAYGNGPFERIGIHSTPTLLAGFLVVCILEAVAGWLLWNGHKSGAILSLALLPFGAAYWWGFALPFPPVFAVMRTGLILISWNALK